MGRGGSRALVLGALVFVGCTSPSTGQNFHEVEPGASSAGSREEPPVPDPSVGSEPTSRDLEIAVVYRESGYRLLAVDAEGVAYALKHDAGGSVLYASTDGARTWSLRGRHQASFRELRPLSGGILMADVITPTGNALARSVDGGRTWQNVLSLGRYRSLQPNNFAELDGEVFFAEYQVFSNDPQPIRLYASTDRGATFRVRHEFSGRRHAHGLVADPSTHSLWILLGDPTGGVLRSRDGGRTFEALAEKVVAVDAHPTEGGLLFGNDALFRPSAPAVLRLAEDGTVTHLADLPGPSYSILKLATGPFLLGETREASGDVYGPDDVSAHLFGSLDGERWGRLVSYPRKDPNQYARVDARWQLPSGEVVLSLENVSVLDSPKGYELVRVRVAQ